MDFSFWSLVGWLVVFLEVSLRLLALGVIPGNRKPSVGQAWLLLILVEPIIGFAIFLMFGRTRLEPVRATRQREALSDITARVMAEPATFDVEQLRPEIQTIVELNQRLGALPITGGNSIELRPEYAATIIEMADEVDHATAYVHVQFYIMAWDEVTDPLFQAMIRATERGVVVRLLFDHIGSRGIPGYKTMLARLAETTIESHAMLPIKPLQGKFRRPDLRNHRKILIVDGRVGFTGSLNLTEPGYNKPKNHKLGREWVELMMRIEGRGVISLNGVFAADWFVETNQRPEWQPMVGDEVVPRATPGTVGCQVVPSGPGIDQENNLRMFNSLVYAATTRLSLTSPYFVPDESLLYAVTIAAQRGVEVELFVSELSDQFMVGHAQASYYKALLRAGVRIWLYPAPYILHSKHFTVNDDVAVIGSSNMDMRSFGLNYEVTVMVPDREVVAAMRAIEDRYREISRELTIEEWSQRPARLKYLDNVMRLTAALQ